MAENFPNLKEMGIQIKEAQITSQVVILLKKTHQNGL
jgi:hypothetical protein